VAIDPAEVRRISELARLELDDEAVASLTSDLQSILDFVALLDTLDVDDVDPTLGAAETTPALREDRPGTSLTNDAALANAPDAALGPFRVPRMIAE